MGDRVLIELTVRRSDFKKATNLVGLSSEEREDAKTKVFYIEECNYGGHSERIALRGAKIPYIAVHGAGDSYGPCIYVCDGEIEKDHVHLDGDLMVIVGENGNVNPEALAYAREFLKFRKRVNKILDGDK